MTDFINILKGNYSNVIRFTFFDYFKTGNMAFDAILSSFILSIVGYFINYIYDFNLDSLLKNISYDFIKSLFFKKHTIILEGKRCSTSSSFSHSYTISSCYSDRFKACNDFIIKNIHKISSIYQIKESHTNFQTSEGDEFRRKNMDVFIVYQYLPFQIDENIYIKTTMQQEDLSNEKEKMNSKVDKITIKIYSYVYDVGYLTRYIDNITYNYKSSIKNTRCNKKYIYTLEKNKKENEDARYDCWNEEIFESTRTFNNIFFEGKNDILDKINFFINNRDWYYEKGIPYTLGIGLHGPPGTGKTSFIKAVANYTNRHLVIISLKLIKTKQQLDHFFFENTYNDNNEKGSISFDKKIIVFEDIDCIGDIILDRKNKSKFTDRKCKSKKISNMNIGEIIQGICEVDNNNSKATVSNVTNEQPITLDDILNLWDGIRETPGRILIITSNHYGKLDSALVRPGRIDITHELSNASHNTISEIFQHLFDKSIEMDKLEKIKNNFYSPAELINLYVSHKNEKDFINRLIKNVKVK
jgi:ATP-dependent Zn protease